MLEGSGSLHNRIACSVVEADFNLMNYWQRLSARCMKTLYLSVIRNDLRCLHLRTVFVGAFAAKISINVPPSFMSVRVQQLVDR